MVWVYLYLLIGLVLGLIWFHLVDKHPDRLNSSEHDHVNDNKPLYLIVHAVAWPYIMAMVILAVRRGDE